MNEGEKKAIEITRTLIEFAGDTYIPKRNREKLQILLNLIEKQQKEIEEAIEYIENAKKELYGCGNYYLLDLLKILKGVKYE